ncbi:MAG: redoxin domain-containing protein [Acidobacteriota bacterium]
MIVQSGLSGGLYLAMVLAAATPQTAGGAPAGLLPGLGLQLAIDSSGVSASRVQPGGRAYRAGLRHGDRILAIDGVPVGGQTLEQVRARLLVNRRDAIHLRVRRAAGGQQDIYLRRPERAPTPARDLSRPPPSPGNPPRSRVSARTGTLLPGPQSGARSEVTAFAAVAVGDRFIDFTLPRIGGGHLVLSSLLGKPIFLDFWATWCAPCRSESAALAEIHRRYGDQIQMIGISLDDDPRHAMAYALRNGLDYPQLAAGRWENPVVRQYGIHRTGIPFNLLIDRKGIIVAMDLHGEPLALAMESLIDGN